MTDIHKLPANSVSEYITILNRSLSSYSGRVRGEVTSISPSAKAIYFTIKDKDEPALLNCMIWLSNYKDNGIVLKENEIAGALEHIVLKQEIPLFKEALKTARIED